MIILVTQIFTVLDFYTKPFNTPLLDFDSSFSEQFGADPLVTNNQRVTALSLACQFGRCAVVQALLQRLSREAKMVKGELSIKMRSQLVR